VVRRVETSIERPMWIPRRAGSPDRPKTVHRSAPATRPSSVPPSTLEQVVVLNRRRFQQLAIEPGRIIAELDQERGSRARRDHARTVRPRHSQVPACILCTTGTPSRRRLTPCHWSLCPKWSALRYRPAHRAGGRRGTRQRRLLGAFAAWRARPAWDARSRRGVASVRSRVAAHRRSARGPRA